MSSLDLEALKAALAALPNQDQWQEGQAGQCNVVAYGGDDIAPVLHAGQLAVHRFVILARNQMPALIAEIERTTCRSRSHDYFMAGNKGFRLDGPYVRTDPNATASPPSMPSSWEAAP